MKITLLTLTLIGLISAAQANNRPTVAADLDSIEQLQRQVQKREFARNGNPYALAKARAWLEFALDEYHDKDHTGIVQDARDEAAAILKQLDLAPGHDASATPHPYASERVREDLWSQVAALKQHPQFACAQQKTAELEVQLVWTGHEKWESGWHHAEPYARIAENLLAEATLAADACIPKPVVTPGAAPVPAERIIVEKRTLATDALFAFNRHGVEYLVWGGKKKLNALATELKTWSALERIQLSGHTDRLGSDRYNQTLSQRRADAIKRYLVKQGIAAERIVTVGQGEAQPIVQCRAQRGVQALIECLQPNRRVEVLIQGVRQ
jgi:outer membrane protein OmpA-like peptidoglycan-associated protein